MVFRRYNAWMVFQQYNGWMVFQRIYTLVEWCSINAMVEWCSNGYSHWLNGVPSMQWLSGAPTDIYNGWGAPSLITVGAKKRYILSEKRYTVSEKICSFPLYYVVRPESADCWPTFCSHVRSSIAWLSWRLMPVGSLMSLLRRALVLAHDACSRSFVVVLKTYKHNISSRPPFKKGVIFSLSPFLCSSF